MSNKASFWIGWLAVSLFVLTACPAEEDPKDGGTPTTTTTTATTTTEDPTDPHCEFRDDPTPPSYTWTYDIDDVTPQTTIRYHIPVAPVGLVVLFDGGGGSQLWFNTMEGRLLTEELVAANYAVLGLPSEGGAPWDDTDSPNNVDVVNLQTAIALLEAGGLPLDLPLYYVGFSKGAGFASFAVRFLPAAALVLFNSAGQASAFDVTIGPSDPPPPTRWIVGRNDPIVTPEDPELEVNFANIAALGIDHGVLFNEPISPLPTAFARIADPVSQVSEADSAAAFDDLVDLGYIVYLDENECPFLAGEAADLDLSQITLGPSFSPAGFADEAKAQIDELHGAHQITSDFNAEIVTLFNSNP